METIAQISDMHLDDFLSRECAIDGRDHVSRILDDIARRGVRTVVFTGDFGERESLEWLREELVRHRVRPFYVLGNHDAYDPFFKSENANRPYREEGMFYSRELEGALLLFLDSSSGAISEIQLEWLLGAAGRARRLVLFIHHPIFDCGDSVMDRMFPLKDRARIQDILLGLDRDISIFCGHYHTDHERRIGRIVQTCAPSSLVQIRPRAERIEPDASYYGYRLIRLSPESAESELIVFN